MSIEEPGSHTIKFSSHKKRGIEAIVVAASDMPKLLTALDKRGMQIKGNIVRNTSNDKLKDALERNDVLQAIALSPTEAEMEQLLILAMIKEFAVSVNAIRFNGEYTDLNKAELETIMADAEMRTANQTTTQHSSAENAKMAPRQISSKIEKAQDEFRAEITNAAAALGTSPHK
jgi:hypothetical protein